MEQTQLNLQPDNDTICAISTAPGTGGIAVARISGKRAIEIADSIWTGKKLSDAGSHTVHLGTIRDSDGQPLDQALVTVFRAPKSYTGEDTIEISIHGSRYIQRQLINLLIRSGCRLAYPGEFTRRALASGQMDLTEAEAVADIIAASSKASHRIAMNQMRGHLSRRLQYLHDQLLELASLLELELDFSEEDVEFASRTKLSDIACNIHSEITRLTRSFSTGSAIKDGIPVAIVGDTNAGKSSLLNIILGDDKAIVSDIHGTTRDIIEDTHEIGDFRFRFMDTAGLRQTDDAIETLGIKRSIEAINRARIVILVIDTTNPINPDTIRQASLPYLSGNGGKLIIAVNKTDITDPRDTIQDITGTIAGLTTGKDTGDIDIIPISALTGQGIDNLKETLRRHAEEAQLENDDVLVTNARHYEALTNAGQAIDRAIDGIRNGISGDFIAQDIRETLHHLSTITGTITTQDILSTIFSRFCIGK